MLTLPVELQREIARPYAEPVYVFDIVLPSRTPGQAPLTLRLSDRYIPRQLVGVPTTGVIHEALALVQDFGVVEIALNPMDGGGAPTTAEPVLLNTKPIAGYARLGDIDADYEFSGARATLFRLGLDTPLAVLYVEEPADVGDTLLRLRMSDITLLIEDRADLVQITRATFPFAHPDAIDQTIPIAIGPLDRVPAHCIETGGRTTLTAAVAIGATTLPVSDTRIGFPAPPFFIQLDGETRAVSAMTDTALTVDPLTVGHAVGAAIRELHIPALVSTTLNGAVSPGATSLVVVSTAAFPATGSFPVLIEDECAIGTVTDATHIAVTPLVASHANGSLVSGGSQVYRYAVCETRGEHFVRAVPAVYNRDVLLTAGFLVNLDERNAIAGRSLVTVTFDTLPAAQVPGTADSIAVSSPSVTTLTRHGTNQPVTISRVNTGSVAGTVNVAAAPPGVTDVTKTVAIRQTSWGTTNAAWSIQRAGGITIWSGPAGTFPVSGAFSWGAGLSYGGETITLIIGAGETGTYTIVVDDLRLDVECSIAIDKTGTVALAGNVDEEPTISASVEGVQDDDAGTITGTPRSLLEIPGHVMRFLATAVYGVPLAELGPRWAAAIGQQANAGLRWAFLFGAEGSPRFSDVRALAGEQSNTRLTVDHGRLDLVWLPDVPIADATLDYTRELWDGAPATLATVSPTQRANRVVASAQQDYAGDAGYRYTVIREDLTAPGFARPVETTLELPWVQDPRTADYLTDRKLREVKGQPREVALVGYQALLGLQTLDHVRIANHPGLAAHGGGATTFRVIAKGYELTENPARIRLSGIEVPA